MLRGRLGAIGSVVGGVDGRVEGRVEGRVDRRVDRRSARSNKTHRRCFKMSAASVEEEEPGRAGRREGAV
jgi:hypothetical protein